MANYNFLEAFKDRPYVSVTVLDVCSPVLYVVREAPSVHSTDECRNFIRLEQRMNAYYHTYEEEIIKLPCKNTLVCVNFDGNWCRGKVESILETTTGPRFTIYLVDYGRTVKVEKSCIRNLKPEMKTLPFQAVKFQLKDLHPCTLMMQADCSISTDLSEDWDISSLEFVKSILEQNKCARIKVEEADFEGTLIGTLMVILQDEYVSLNEELICNNYARIVPKTKPEILDKEISSNLKQKEMPEYESFESYYRKKNLRIRELEEFKNEFLINREKKNKPPCNSICDGLSLQDSETLKDNFDISHGSVLCSEMGNKTIVAVSEESFNSDENRQCVTEHCDIKKLNVKIDIAAKSETTMKNVVQECPNYNQINTDSSSRHTTESNQTVNSNISLGKRILHLLKQDSVNKKHLDGKVLSTPRSQNESNPSVKSITLHTKKQNSVSSMESKNPVSKNKIIDRIQVAESSSKNESQYFRNNNNTKENIKLSSAKCDDVRISKIKLGNSDSLTHSSASDGNIQNLESKLNYKNPPISSLNVRGILNRIKLENKCDKTKELDSKFESTIFESKPGISKISNTTQLDMSSNTISKQFVLNPKSRIEMVAKSNVKDEISQEKSGMLSEVIDKNKEFSLSEEDAIESVPEEENAKCRSLNSSFVEKKTEIISDIENTSNLSCNLDSEKNKIRNSSVFHNNPKNISDQVNNSLSMQNKDANTFLFSKYLQRSSSMKTDASDLESFIWEKEQSVRSICHGKGFPKPMRNVSAAPFAIPIIEVLNEHHFPSPSPIQTVMWPAMFRGRNFVSIASAHSGKTFGYLLPLLSSLFQPTLYENIPSNGGPIALILCSNWKKVLNVHNNCQLLLEKYNHIKVLEMYGGGCETVQKISLVNGCDILIATPPCLLRHLKDEECKMINLQRCCHLIIEDGDVILTKFCPEIIEIIVKYAKDNKQNRINNLKQLVICSEHWNEAISSFMQTCMHEPLVFITAFHEGAVYSQVPTYCHVCLETEVFTLIIQILSGCAGKRVVICTNSYDSAHNIVQLVKNSAIYTLFIHSRLLHYDKDNIIREWKNSYNCNSTVVIVITDDCIFDVDINDANCIIQCELDKISFTQFGQRYSYMLDNFLTLKDVQAKAISPSVCHILVTENCKIQVKNLIKFLNRLPLPIPKKLLIMEDERKKELEDCQIELCYYLKAFGHCFQENCKNRHKIVKKYDQIMNLPVNSRVKVLITNVIDAIHYYGRIIECKDTTGESSSSHSYLVLSIKLTEYYSVKENCMSDKNIKVGNMYVVEKQGNTFHRVRVLDIVNFNNIGEPRNVKVHYLDDGGQEIIYAHKLLKIPSELISYPAQVVEIYICNVQPVDKCFEWTTQADTFVHNIISGKEMEGKLVLCLGYTIWLDPFVHYVTLENNLKIIETKITTALIKDHYAIPNPDHLKKLRSLCEGEITSFNNILANEKEENNAEISHAVPQAFLELDQIYEVSVWQVHNPNFFYIQQLNFKKQICDISNECEKMLNNNMLIRLKHFQKESLCIAPFVDGNLCRACIKEEEEDSVDLFYVDYGVNSTVKKSGLYVIPSNCLLLPFQAIKCSLTGIPFKDNWNKKVIDKFNDFIDCDDDKKVLYAKALKQEFSVSGEKYYLIKLWNSDFDFTEEFARQGYFLQDNTVETNPKELNDDNFCETTNLNNLMEDLNDEIKQTVSLSPENQNQQSVNKKSNIPKLSSNILQIDKNIVTPQVTWWQKKEEIIITIHVIGVKDFDIDIKEKQIYFSAIVNGKCYRFEEELFSLINDNMSKARIYGQNVEIRLSKAKKGLKWPRLIATEQKKIYIKLNFDHLDDSESEEDIPKTKITFDPKDVLNFEPTDVENSEENSEFEDDDYNFI
ncbi:putative ATP-dependent RNA helicase TDRD12 [Centruroides sculpturatus]|uniref:putative ATP-dependent RNA helicase TDRD12 n=1 Tax=Centruroides sculpturatus TaxID=218467 RepID=UPI000C6E5C08|nr:putative ATP-dependent RNA helicase TDRD12 [Centruroides sculpturatus]